jgi:hypothetical protein
MIDNKFIDPFIDSAEIVAPGKNVYIFTFASPSSVVKSAKGIFALPFSNEFNTIIEGINENDRLYIHWFEKYITDVIRKIPPKVPVYLFFWGGDFLGQTNEFFHFNFDPLSRKYFYRDEKKSLRYFPRNPVGYIKNINKYLYQQRIKKVNAATEREARIHFLKRLNYFCHWNHLDMKTVVDSYGGRPVLLDFFYDGSLETVNIWLGNSDVLTNNHLDALVALKKFRYENVKLLCPLNYENGDYGQYIAKQGLKLFGEKWHPFTEFMPIGQYLRLLETVDIVIMNHNRTQAAGNIFAFIRMGKKVFIKKQSSIYSLLTANGITIFDANKINDLSFEELSEPLSREEIENNYAVISEMFSDKKRLAYLSEILN